MADMDVYARVLQNALAHGKRVAPGVHLYLQFGSQKIKQYARQKGYIEIFTSGAELIDQAAAPASTRAPELQNCRDRNRQRAEPKLPRPQWPGSTIS